MLKNVEVHCFTLLSFENLIKLLVDEVPLKYQYIDKMWMGKNNRIRTQYDGFKNVPKATKRWGPK